MFIWYDVLSSQYLPLFCRFIWIILMQLCNCDHQCHMYFLVEHILGRLYNLGKWMVVLVAQRLHLVRCCTSSQSDLVPFVALKVYCPWNLVCCFLLRCSPFNMIIWLKCCIHAKYSLVQYLCWLCIEYLKESNCLQIWARCPVCLGIGSTHHSLILIENAKEDGLLWRWNMVHIFRPWCLW